jgi:pilus assembly protein CpaF
MSGFLKQLQNSKSKRNSSSHQLLMEPTLTNIQDRDRRYATRGDETSSESKKPIQHTTEKTVDRSRTDYEQTKILEAEQLMAELLQESATGASMPSSANEETSSGGETQDPEEGKQGRRPTHLKIVRRRNQEKPSPSVGGYREDKLPWWLRDDKKTTPQVELLVPAARKMLNEVLPSEGEIVIDLEEAVRKAVELAASNLSSEIRIGHNDQEDAIKELYSLLTGKGPLQPLYDDPAVTDIFVDNHESIKAIRRGRAVETPFYFRSPDEYKAYVSGMLQQVDRVLNRSSPIVDCVLPDAWRSRINAVDSSLVDGDEPRICIRVPRLQQISFYDILQTKTLPATLAAWLAEVVAMGEANILVLGATGSGKTVFTTALLSAVGSDERIITIEDVPEVFVPTAHLEKLVGRPPNASGQGEVKMPDLLRAALRRAPHRIVVGEIRDEEGRLFLRALETGHAGSIATIHAESGKDCLWRLLDLVAAYENSPQESIVRRISRAVHLLITMKKVQGKPCLIEVSEVRPPVDGQFITTELIKFAGVKNGKRQWQIMQKHSYWLDKIRERGLDLQPGPGLLPPSPIGGSAKDDSSHGEDL